MVNQPQICEIIFARTLLGHYMMDVEPFAIFQTLVADRANAWLPLDQLATEIRSPPGIWLVFVSSNPVELGHRENTYDAPDDA